MKALENKIALRERELKSLKDKDKMLNEALEYDQNMID